MPVLSTTAMLLLTLFVGSGIVFYTMAARAQQLAAEPKIEGFQAPVPKAGPVSFLGDTAQVPAGRDAAVELRFRVAKNFHVNSHHPKSDLLLPTTLTVEGADGLHVGLITFPTGQPFHLDIGEGEMLDVYEDEFRVTVHVTAPKGMSALRGALRYQACDKAACYPPRTLPVMVTVNAE